MNHLMKWCKNNHYNSLLPIPNNIGFKFKITVFMVLGLTATVAPSTLGLFSLGLSDRGPKHLWPRPASPKHLWPRPASPKQLWPHVSSLCWSGLIWLKKINFLGDIYYRNLAPNRYGLTIVAPNTFGLIMLASNCYGLTLVASNSFSPIMSALLVVAPVKWVNRRY